ncbi:MAG: hypothetical protein ACR2MR_13530 [Dietzia maris]
MQENYKRNIGLHIEGIVLDSDHRKGHIWFFDDPTESDLAKLQGFSDGGYSYTPTLDAIPTNINSSLDIDFNFKFSSCNFEIVADDLNVSSFFVRPVEIGSVAAIISTTTGDYVDSIPKSTFSTGTSLPVGSIIYIGDETMVILTDTGTEYILKRGAGIFDQNKTQIHYVGSKIYTSPPYLENRVVTLFYYDEDGGSEIKVIWKGFFNSFKTNDSQTSIQFEAVDYISKLLDVDCGSTKQYSYPTETFVYRDVDGRIRLDGRISDTLLKRNPQVNAESHPDGAPRRVFLVDDWAWYFRRNSNLDFNITGDTLYDIYPDDKEINTVLDSSKTFKELVFVDRTSSDPNRWDSTFKAAAIEPTLRQAPDFEGIKRAQIRPMDMLNSSALISNTNVPRDGLNVMGGLIPQGRMRPVSGDFDDAGQIIDDGSGRYALELTAGDELAITGLDIDPSNGITFFGVAKFSNWTIYQGLFRGDNGINGPSTSTVELYTNGSTTTTYNQVAFTNRTGGTSGFASSASGQFQKAQIESINAVFDDGTTKGIYDAGTLLNPGTLTQPVNNIKRIMFSGYNNVPFTGYIYDWIVYDAALTQAQIDEVQAYIEETWNAAPVLKQDNIIVGVGAGMDRSQPYYVKAKGLINSRTIYPVIADEDKNQPTLSGAASTQYGFAYHPLAIALSILLSRREKVTIAGQSGWNQNINNPVIMDGFGREVEYIFDILTKDYGVGIDWEDVDCEAWLQEIWATRTDFIEQWNPNVDGLYNALDSVADLLATRGYFMTLNDEGKLTLGKLKDFTVDEAIKVNQFSDSIPRKWAALIEPNLPLTRKPQQNQFTVEIGNNYIESGGTATVGIVRGNRTDFGLGISSSSPINLNFYTNKKLISDGFSFIERLMAYQVYVRSESLPIMSIKTPWKWLDDDGNECIAPQLGQWVRMTGGPESGVIGPDGTRIQINDEEITFTGFIINRTFNMEDFTIECDCLMLNWLKGNSLPLHVAPSAVVTSYSSSPDPVITITGPNNITNGLQATVPYIQAFKTFLLNERVRFVKFDGKQSVVKSTAASDYATIVGITPVIGGNGVITSWKLELDDFLNTDNTYIQNNDIIMRVEPYTTYKTNTSISLPNSQFLPEKYRYRFWAFIAEDSGGFSDGDDPDIWSAK